MRSLPTRSVKGFSLDMANRRSKYPYWPLESLMPANCPGREQGGRGLDGDLIREVRNVIEENARGSSHSGGELHIKLVDVFLAVPEKVGRHEQQSGGPGRYGIATQRYGTIQRRVPNAYQHRHAAALHGQLHQPHTVVESKVQELAGRAEQRDAIHAGRGQKIHELEHGADIGFVALTLRRNGGNVDSGDRESQDPFVRLRAQ